MAAGERLGCWSQGVRRDGLCVGRIATTSLCGALYEPEAAPSNRPATSELAASPRSAVIAGRTRRIGWSVCPPDPSIGVPVQASTVMLAIDVSPSMAATDIKPSRVQAVQDAANSTAKTLSPRSSSPGHLQRRRHGPGPADCGSRSDQNGRWPTLEPVPQAAIGESIFAALDAIRRRAATEGKRAPATTLLLSDGVTNAGRPNAEAASGRQGRRPGVDNRARHPRRRSPGVRQNCPRHQVIRTRPHDRNHESRSPPARRSLRRCATRINDLGSITTHRTRPATSVHGSFAIAMSFVPQPPHRCGGPHDYLDRPRVSRGASVGNPHWCYRQTLGRVLLVAATGSYGRLMRAGKASGSRPILSAGPIDGGAIRVGFPFANHSHHVTRDSEADASSGRHRIGEHDTTRRR